MSSDLSLEGNRSDATMHHMKQASVSDLRYQFKAVERLLQRGQKIDITKRGRVIARLHPVSTKPVPPKRPDFRALLKKIYGDRILTPSNVFRSVFGREPK